MAPPRDSNRLLGLSDSGRWHTISNKVCGHPFIPKVKLGLLRSGTVIVDVASYKSSHAHKAQGACLELEEGGGMGMS